MKIRRATLADAGAIAAIYEPYVSNSVVSFELEPPTADEMRARIADVGATHPWLVAEEDGRIAGYVYGSKHRARAAYQWAADVTAYLHPDFQRQGLGRTLYNALFALLRAQGFHSVYAGITLPNDASVALHRAMGMREIGVYTQVGFKLGAWRDVLWMGVTLGSGSPAGAPIDFARLDETVVATELARAIG